MHSLKMTGSGTPSWHVLLATDTASGTPKIGLNSGSAVTQHWTTSPMVRPHRYTRTGASFALLVPTTQVNCTTSDWYHCVWAQQLMHCHVSHQAHLAKCIVMLVTWLNWLICTVTLVTWLSWLFGCCSNSNFLSLPLQFLFLLLKLLFLFSSPFFLFFLFFPLFLLLLFILWSR